VKDGAVSIAGGLQTTLVIDPKAASVVATLPGHGNYEEFGTLLIERRVRLRDEADAKVVWEAFCDLHHKHWKDNPHKRTGATEWRIGVKTIDTQTYYTRVRTDPKTHHVLAWELVVDAAEKQGRRK
jgi:hypothetical protein